MDGTRKMVITIVRGPSTKKKQMVITNAHTLYGIYIHIYMKISREEKHVLLPAVCVVSRATKLLFSARENEVCFFIDFLHGTFSSNQNEQFLG